MDKSGQSALEARNEAFRRLGRNVYLIQLIERQLKHLVVHSTIDGPMDELPKTMAANTKRASKKSMGQLTGQVIDDLFRKRGQKVREPDNPTKHWFSWSFRIEADDVFVRQRKKELQLLVAARNKLIHTSAVDIRLDDADKWIQLGESLDEQRAELVVQHEKLRLLIQDLYKAAKDRLQADDLELQALERDSNKPSS